MSEGRDSPVSFFTLYTILVHLIYGIPSTTFLPVSFPRTSSIYVMFSTSRTIHRDIPTAGNFENDYLFVLYYSGGAFCFCWQSSPVWLFYYYTSLLIYVYVLGLGRYDNSLFAFCSSHGNKQSTSGSHATALTPRLIVFFGSVQNSLGCSDGAFCRGSHRIFIGRVLHSHSPKWDVMTMNSCIFQGESTKMVCQHDIWSAWCPVTLREQHPFPATQHIVIVGHDQEKHSKGKSALAWYDFDAFKNGASSFVVYR